MSCSLFTDRHFQNLLDVSSFLIYKKREIITKFFLNGKNVMNYAETIFFQASDLSDTFKDVSAFSVFFFLF